jgi:hypothetical protein
MTKRTFGERSDGGTGRGARRSGGLAALAALACGGLVGACVAPGEEVDASGEAVGAAEQELTVCRTIIRSPYAAALVDATIATDPLIPSRADENFGATPLISVGVAGTATRVGLLRFELSPLGANVPIISAKLRLTRVGVATPGGVHVHRVTAGWAETTVTWNGFNAAFDPAALSSFVPTSVAGGSSIDVDVTAAVQAWVDGTQPNEGLALVAPDGSRASFAASESGSATGQPQLRVCYVPSTCSDGAQNGLETGLDCGGPCGPCSDGGGCTVDADCQSGVCAGGLCQAPTCADGVLNGNEVAPDCGGSCAVPEACNGVDDDCNGLTDEGNPESGAACSTGLPGACSGGTTACSGGALTCTADSAGTPEVCDGLDNDCNGAVDDGVSFTGALASWPADGSANDALGTHDGTLLGGMGYGAGLAGSAFQFDGVDDAATFGTTLGDFGTADFSLEFWMSTTSTRLEGLINKRSVCGNGSFFDIRLSGGRLKVELNQSGSNVNSFNSAQTINDGSWHHVVLTRQAKTVQLYIDGSLDTAKSTAGTTNISNGVAFSMAQHVCIGVDPTQRLTGLLDEVHVFGRALSATEVAQLKGLVGAACVSP